MADFETRIHCIGEYNNGIVIVTFNPFRVLTIGWESIKAYAETLSDEPDVMGTYRSLCKALTALVLDLSDEDSLMKMDEQPAPLSALFSMGTMINNSDLCLTGRIDAKRHNMPMGDGTTESRRKGYSMIHAVVDAINNGVPETPYEIQPVKDDNYSGGHDHGHDHDHDH